MPKRHVLCSAFFKSSCLLSLINMQPLTASPAPALLPGTYPLSRTARSAATPSRARRRTTLTSRSSGSSPSPSRAAANRPPAADTTGQRTGRAAPAARWRHGQPEVVLVVKSGPILCPLCPVRGSFWAQTCGYDDIA